MSSPDPRLQTFLETCRERVDAALGHWLPDADTHPASLHEAMRYAVLDGGKRVRPTLVYAAGQAVGAAEQALDGPACAVELIHAYSLTHDDLPAMDDDDLRRGKPTCHKVYGEATAMLAGDSLQALAFYILAHDPEPTVAATDRVRMIEALALAAGSRGMAGGQAIDLAAVGHQLGIAQLEDMHIHKTGALIRASVLLGALCRAGLETSRLDRLDHYAKCIGLAFQIRDDILDVSGDSTVVGKPIGSDQARDKPTYPALLGLEGAARRAVELHEEAMESLADFDERADPLRWLSAYIVQRAS
ncbi:MAG TPA: farnesyl diphosphate synthase [Gammaproteobacteria bacterium]|nr:farnesyl diphosphate synthase [Gammaproteobacteria bacterium]